jgi:molybdopterin-containing oxidoreductase family iron-sulfur binding subunit
MRVDRYYHRDDTGELRMIHQPMMCQHCDHAPCETVCPVLATVHSQEGLNQQVYNRCVGTRYCANNCPYKVRRFNWFDYPRNDEENLVLNPDVTVRMRGVMEKCSFCIQRIEDARIRANAEGRSIADGDVLPACMQSCPTKAIRFGDMNQPDSLVRRASAGPRFYRALEELGVKPSVGYLMNVRNTRTGKTEDSHG